MNAVILWFPCSVPAVIHKCLLTPSFRDCRNPEAREGKDYKCPVGTGASLYLGLKKHTALTKQPCVYLLASQQNGTLYIGVTSDLIKRIYQHRTNMLDGFTKRYGIHQLVWYEVHETMDGAILREKQIKNWSRKAKTALIEQQNPNWQDLWSTLVSPSLASGFRQSMPE